MQIELSVQEIKQILTAFAVSREQYGLSQNDVDLKEKLKTLLNKGE